MEGSIQQTAVAFTGEDNPSFLRVQEYAEALLDGMEPLLRAGLPLIVVVENDMAKVLGQTMYHLLEWKREVICLDGIHLAEGEYIDIGSPLQKDVYCRWWSKPLFLVNKCNCSVPSQLRSKIHVKSPLAMGFLPGC